LGEKVSNPLGMGPNFGPKYTDRKNHALSTTETIKYQIKMIVSSVRHAKYIATINRATPWTEDVTDGSNLPLNNVHKFYLWPIKLCRIQVTMNVQKIHNRHKFQ